MSLLPYLNKWLVQLNCDRITDSNEGLTCCCPFHKDRKPSFTINGKNGLWICWSANCPYGKGNLAQLLVYGFGMSMSKARDVVSELPILIDVESISGLPPWKDRHKKPDDEEMSEGLLGLYDGCPRYLLKRGFTKEVLKHFEVGYDRDTDYAVIPCRDLKGRLVGISKRSCSGQEPKWVHELFSKGNHLFNAYRARWDRTENGLVPSRGIVVEGQLDAMWLVQHGWLNSVSTLSANVTTTQVDLLVKCFSEVTIFFDSDEAGMLGAFYLAKKLYKRVPTFVVTYGELLLKPDVLELNQKLDPSRLTLAENQQALDGRQEALVFIDENTAAVAAIQEKRKRMRLSYSLQKNV